MSGAALFNGNYVKLLKDQLKLFNTASILTGTTDPTVTAADAPAGSIYMRVGSTNKFYQKLDSGSTTNWREISSTDAMAIQLVTAGVASMLGGSIYLSDGRILSTYSGSGSSAASFDAPLSITLSSLLTPTNGLKGYLYIDLSTLAGSPTNVTGSALYLYPVTVANMVMTSVAPESTDGSRYLYLADFIADATPVWAATNWFTAPKRSYQLPLKYVSPITYTLAPQVVGSVGSAAQISQGHVLTIDSFPSVLANVSFWSLAANLTDGNTTNNRALSGTVSSYATPGLFGTDTAAVLVNNALTRSDAFFIPASNTTPFAAAGWFKFTNWKPASQQAILMVGSAGSNNSWEMHLNTDGSLTVQASTSSASAYDKTLNIANPNFAAASYHHLAVVFNGTTLLAYVDGRLVGSVACAAVRVPSIGSFAVGSGSTSMTVREVMYNTATLYVDEDIRKLAAYRVDHNKNTAAINQRWAAGRVRADGEISEEMGDESWMVDKTNANKLYVDFSDINPLDMVYLKLYDETGTAVSVLPTKTFDTGWMTAQPTGNITHGLPDVPGSVVLQYEAITGEYTFLNINDYLSWNSTVLKPDLAAFGLLTISASHKWRIIASLGAFAIGLQTASLSQSGIVSLADQHFAGNKFFQGNITPEVDNTYNLGSPSAQWASAYAVNATVSGSFVNPGINGTFAAGTQGFVDQSALISVPNTAIVGRAKIPDLANDLRASLGVERIMTQSIVQLQNEFGASGEPVYAAVNDDRGLIRFVGGYNPIKDAYGQYIQCTLATDYVEVVFYGTGLNVLATYSASAFTNTYYLDGSASPVTFLSATPSSILAIRNYSPNTVVPVVSGLTLGMHTVKIVITTNMTAWGFTGFEILNASGLININPGVGYLNGQKYVNTLADSVAYNTGVTGTRGGRVVRYLNADGTAGQAFTAVNAAAAYLTSADHTNEEVVRTYHWREFGCGRADDFSLPFTSTDRAFTLDDGTTTLTASGMTATGADYLDFPTNSAFLTFTFVGCGVDVFRKDTGTGGSATLQYYVDGASVGSTSQTNTGLKRRESVVSGLPYGTHTLKIARTAAATNDPTLYSFVVYQPKKPTIPATALEICDYNVMGDYVGSTATLSSEMSSGVLSKCPVRELVYVGTFGGGVVNNTANDSPFGWAVTSSTATDYVQYTFFGSGFELMATISTGPSVWTVWVDGSQYLGSATANTGSSWSAPAWTMTNQSRLKVTGLSLGVHTVKLVLSGTFTNARLCAFSVITPIHAVKSNLYADLQNTLPVGSCSLTDSRKTSLIKEQLPQVKSFAQAIGVTSGPTVTSSSLIPAADLSTSLKTNGGPVEISYNASMYHSVAATLCTCQVYVDGAAVVTPKVVSSPGAGATYVFEVSDSIILTLSAGYHKIDCYVATGASTLTLCTTDRSLVVREL